MVLLRFENLVSQTEQQKPWIEFSNLAGLSPVEQWFYHWVQRTGLASPYPDLEAVKSALLTHFPQRTQRYSRHIPEPTSAESWLRTVLLSGELLQVTPLASKKTLTIAVHPSALPWKEGFEKIESPEFRAVRRELGIDKHWLLIVEGISDLDLASGQLIMTIEQHSLDQDECAVIHFSC